MSLAIWWIRRDLRLEDNRALSAAISTADQVLPVFILDPKLLDSQYVGEKRISFLLAGLRKLDEDLKKRRSYLVLRSGDPLEELSALSQNHGGATIYAEADYSPYARRRDDRIARRLNLFQVGSPAILPPGSVLKSDGSPYTIFTPFSRRWKTSFKLLPKDLLPAPTLISTPAGIETQKIPNQPQISPGVPFQAGEAAALSHLKAFIEGPVYGYGESRNRLDLEGTSRLSPYLRFGMISARQVALKAFDALHHALEEAARNSVETWLDELIWRDFYLHILAQFPRVRSENFRSPAVRWDNNQDQFQAWCRGRTGYPIVDAAMRQLTNSGWMHNRARMIVASFLTKDLLIDWRWGERWFMQHLVDGDPAANNGGWQWAAGTGNDAAPYFRIFNPVAQSRRYDPEGNYIRSWLQELAQVPREFVHEPWKMSLTLQARYSCTLGKDYPHPILDHAWARERALQAYRHRNGSLTQEQGQL